MYSVSIARYTIITIHTQYGCSWLCVSYVNTTSLFRYYPLCTISVYTVLSWMLNTTRLEVGTYKNGPVEPSPVFKERFGKWKRNKIYFTFRTRTFCFAHLAGSPTAVRCAYDQRAYHQFNTSISKVQKINYQLTPVYNISLIFPRVCVPHYTHKRVLSYK